MNNIQDNRGNNYLNRQNSMDGTNNINSRKVIHGNLTNTKSYTKRYTDVHANSKILYHQDGDSIEKKIVEQSQWNDRTNRYFYLKEQNNTNINKNANNTVDSYYNQKFLENNNYGTNFNSGLSHINYNLNNMQNNIEKDFNSYKGNVNYGLKTNQNNIKFVK